MEAEGYSVWWDRHIAGGAEFSKDIERELAAAKVVIVAWSKEANDSRWVRDEAGLAAEAGKLIAVSIDGAEPPIGFKQFHAIDFAEWKGAAGAQAMRDLGVAVEARVTGEAPPVSSAPITVKTSWTEHIKKPVPLAIAGAIFAVLSAAVFFMLSGAKDGASDGGGASAVAAAESVADASAEPSIAVLPFVALSNDAGDIYFGKGVAEELLNALTQLPELKVAARTSAFSFEGRNVDLREVGEQLGVSHVLEGSVRRGGDRVRVTAQLIRASDGLHLWSETYERELTDIFAIQDDIVKELSRNLQIRLGVGGGSGRAPARDVEPRAYAAYLRGLALWGDRGRGTNRLDALGAFVLATEIDPDFADAWAAIGLASTRSSAHMLGYSDEEFVPRTREAFARALELDSENARAHAGLAVWHVQYDIDVAKAKNHLAQALSLAPNSATVHYSAAQVANMHGDYPGALAAFNRTVSLDPLNITVRRVRAGFLAGVGRHDEAIAFFDQCERDACIESAFLYGLRLASLMLAGREEEARALYERIKNDESLMNDFMIVTGTVLGDRQAQDRLGDVLKNRSDDSMAPFYSIASAHVGDDETALELIFDAYQDKMLFAQPFSRYPFYNGAYQFPERFLLHPRYREFWGQPGMKELAEARRANGQTAGLPLPQE